jgi:hypothetical protein
LERNGSEKKIETVGNNSLLTGNIMIRKKSKPLNLTSDASKERQGAVVNLGSLLEGDITYEKKDGKLQTSGSNFYVKN